MLKSPMTTMFSYLFMAKSINLVSLLKEIHTFTGRFVEGLYMLKMAHFLFAIFTSRQMTSMSSDSRVLIHLAGIPCFTKSMRPPPCSFLSRLNCHGLK